MPVLTCDVGSSTPLTGNGWTEGRMERERDGRKAREQDGRKEREQDGREEREERKGNRSWGCLANSNVGNT